MTEYQVTKIPGPYHFNDDDVLVGVEVPPGHRVEMLKGKGDKGKPLTCYIVPDLSEQLNAEILRGDENTPDTIKMSHSDSAAANQILAMLVEMLDRNQKLRLNEFDDGEIAARDYVLDVAKLAERFFVDGRSLGVKQAMIEEWIIGVLHPYMVARISKNDGFTAEQKVSFPASLMQKYLIASTRDNETKDKRGNVLKVSKESLIDLQKRLEQYSTDEGNMLPMSDELDSMMKRITKHIATVQVELEVTKDQF